MSTITQESPLRERSLFSVVDRLNKIHEMWADDPNRPVPDAQYWDAVGRVIDTFKEGDIPSSCRALAETVAELESELFEFEDRPNPSNQYPRDNFWNVRERLQKLRTNQEHPLRRPTESIAALMELPNMTHEQVARMWNFFDVQGRVMPWLVQKEIDKPGSIVDDHENAAKLIGPHWRHPDEPDPPQEVAMKPDPRLKKKKQEAERLNQPCAETPRELWEQGLKGTAELVQQAAKMLCKPLAEVEAMWKEFESESEEDTDLDEDKAPAGDEAELKSKACELKGLGHSASEIARQMGISTQKVTALLK